MGHDKSERSEGPVTAHDKDHGCDNDKLHLLSALHLICTEVVPVIENGATDMVMKVAGVDEMGSCAGAECTALQWQSIKEAGIDALQSTALMMNAVKESGCDGRSCMGGDQTGWQEQDDQE